MTLFDGKPMEVPIVSGEVKKGKQPGQKRKQKLPIVLSASRMTDLPKYYPRELIAEVDKRIAKGLQIHTIVLWTKHPASLLEQPLYDYLIRMKEAGVQLFLNCTITGMGQQVVGHGKDGMTLVLEPNSPTVEEALGVLPAVIKLLGKPERIRLRIDPIVRIEDAIGERYSNLKMMPFLIERLHQLRISNYCFSFLEGGTHRKVDRRFNRIGAKIISPTTEERERMVEWINKLQTKYGVSIHGCCVTGFPDTRCIDGALLQKLHDHELPVDESEPRSREKCGCTQSIDIGGWPPKKCYTGCQYCYANSSY